MEKKFEKPNWIGILPLILIVGFIPIIVHLKIVPSTDSFYQNTYGTANYDFYSYYKMIFFLIFTSIAFALIVLKFCMGGVEIKKSVINYYAVLFIIFSLFSFLLSKDKNISSIGYFDRYEGIYVLIAYMFILIFTINVVQAVTDIWYIIYGLIFSSLIVGIIGLTQLAGHDLFQTTFGKHLMTFGIKGFDISAMRTTIENRMVYSTLYHPDYVGSFTAMLFPLFFSLFILLKGMKNKIIFGFMSLVMIITLIGSRSRAGIIGAIISLVVLLIIHRRYFIKKWKYSIAFLAGVLILLLVMNKVTGGTLFKKIFTSNIDVRQSINAGKLENVEVENNTAKIYTQNTVLNIIYTGQNFQFEDEGDIPITTKLVNNQIVLNDDRYKDFSILTGMAGRFPIIVTNLKDIKMIFAVANNEIKFVNYKNQIVDLPEVSSFGFKGKEQLGSGRGYIWSRSIPLLQDTLLVGHGPDSFAMYFPQNDYIGKLITYGTMNMLVDKPHDLYLQTAINTGGVSLLALLGIFITYIVQSIKLFWKNDFSKMYSSFGISIFLGVVGYLAAGIFNDSALSVAPVFWVLLGVGVSINLNIIKGKSTK